MLGGDHLFVSLFLEFDISLCAKRLVYQDEKDCIISSMFMRQCADEGTK